MVLTAQERDNAKPFQWWTAPKHAMVGQLVSTWRYIAAQQKPRFKRWNKWLGLYEGREIHGLQGDQWAQYAPSDLLKINVIESVIDSVTAKIATNKPRALFLTDGGDWDLQNQAKLATHLVDGVYHDQGIFAKSRDAFTDSCVWPRGHILIYPCFQSGKVKAERVLPSEILVDDIDGKYRSPRTIYRHKVMTRAEVAAMWEIPIHSLEESGLLEPSSYYNTAIDDPISLIEAWHLPSGKGKKDGVHIQATTNRKLASEPWNADFFPICTSWWKKRRIGFDGKPLTEVLETNQEEIYYIAQKIQKLMNLATTRVYLEAGSKVSEHDLTNDEMTIVEFTGQPPVFSPDTPVHPQFFSRLQELKAEAYEMAGISQLTATSRKPAGLNSGAAQREYKDTESQRFLDVGQAWEEFHLEIADRIIWAAQELHEKGKGFKVQVPDERGRALLELKWSDVAIRHGTYKLKVWPTSLLPQTPAGRLETVRELLSLFPEMAPTAADLLDFPDVNEALSLLSAPIEAIKLDIQKLNDGDSVAPEPFLDLQSAKAMVLAAYLKIRNEGAPDEIQENFRQYLLSVQKLIEESMMPPEGMVPGAPGAGQPGAVLSPPVPGLPGAPGAMPSLPPGV